jgi:DNA-binding NarL/FixJ family response regulator
MTDPVKVLVAEDHFVTREGLRRLLEEQDDIVVVGCAANPAEAMQLAQRTRPDVLVTDIRMPPTNTTEGIDLAHSVREMLPGCGVVVLSQHDDEEYVWALFADGVAGYAYLHKLRVGDAEQLVRAIHEVASGGSVLDPAIVAQLLARRARGAPADGRGLQQRGDRVGDAAGHGNRREAYRFGVHEAGADRTRGRQPSGARSPALFT